MAATAAPDVCEGPFLNLIHKRLQALRTKENLIAQMEESFEQGKALNKEQMEVLRSKPTVTVLIEELEKLLQPLSLAVSEEQSLGVQRLQVSGSNQPLSGDMPQDDDSPNVAQPSESDDCQDASVEDLLNLLWLAKSDQPIEPNATVTPASLRERPSKIMSSDCFTTTPEMKAPKEVGPSTVHGSISPVPVSVMVEGSVGQSQQKAMDKSGSLIIPEDDVFSAKIQLCQAKVGFILEKLKPTQRQKFIDGCFGHLRDIDSIVWSNSIVHGMMVRKAICKNYREIDGVGFLVGNRVLQFTKADFCLITGLCCGERPEMNIKDDNGVNRLKDTYFKDIRKVTIDSLLTAFKECEDPDDQLKLGLVYFVEQVLLGREKTNAINLDFLKLVEDLEVWNSYPWGTVSYEKTHDSISRALKIEFKKKRGNHKESDDKNDDDNGKNKLVDRGKSIPMRKTRGRKSEPESSEEETEVELEEEGVETAGNKLKRKVKGKAKLASKRLKKATNSNGKVIKEEYVHENDDEDDGDEEDEPINVKGKGKKSHKPRCAYKLRGFPYAFQAWACEILPDLEETKIVMLNRKPGVARLFHWKVRAGGSFFKLQSHVFNSQKVQLRQLVPTEEEKKAPYWAWASKHDIGVPEAPENDSGRSYTVRLEPAPNDDHNPRTSVRGNPDSPEWEKLVMMLMERVTTLGQENAELRKRVESLEIHQGKDDKFKDDVDVQLGFLRQHLTDLG